MDFAQRARKLIEKNVKVVTVDGIFVGKLLTVGEDFLTLQLRSEKVIIRVPLIIALFRVQGEIANEFELAENDEDDVLDEFESFLLED